MLLRNYYNLLAGQLFNYESTNDASFEDGILSYKRTNGSMVRLHIFAHQHINLGPIAGRPSSASSSSDGYNYICFGSSNTPVSFDDYTLGNDISSSLSVTNIYYSTPIYDTNTKTYSSNCSLLLSNAVSSPVTINEIGIVTVTGGYGAGYGYILLYREVLETPITLAAGESVTYTHNFEFTMPTIG